MEEMEGLLAEGQLYANRRCYKMDDAAMAVLRSRLQEEEKDQEPGALAVLRIINRAIRKAEEDPIDRLADELGFLPRFRPLRARYFAKAGRKEGSNARGEK